MARPKGSTNKSNKAATPVEQDSEGDVIAQLIERAVQREDHTVETSSGEDFPPPPAGKTVGRFIEYIELGLQAQKAFQGKVKSPCEMVSVAFELLSPKNIHEVDTEEGKKTFADKIYLTMPKKLSGKAKFKKLFDAMRYDRKDITHMSQMLGQPFILDIKHSEPSTSGKVYANITDKEGNSRIYAPKIEDPLTGNAQVVKVPLALSPVRIFMFDDPNQITWDKLFIDGTYTKDGQEHSKNFIQEKIMSALNFEGSGLQALLAGVDSLPDVTEDTDEQEEQEDVEPTPASTVSKASMDKLKAPAGKKPVSVVVKPTSGKAVATVKTVNQSPSKSVTDQFAELGLKV